MKHRNGMIDKECSCGKKFIKLPTDFRFVCCGDAFDGIYFDCDQCGSTIFIRSTTKSDSDLVNKN